jgi:hypothetical protein
MNFDDKIKWCIEQHQNTNHFYDTYLPYEFHLRMVAKVAKDFIKVIEGSSEGDVSEAIQKITLQGVDDGTGEEEERSMERREGSAAK